MLDYCLKENNAENYDDAGIHADGMSTVVEFSSGKVALLDSAWQLFETPDATESIVKKIS